MFDQHLTNEDRVNLINQRLRLIAADAYSNFLIGRALAAQGAHEMADEHDATVERLSKSISALENERARWLPKPEDEAVKAEEAPHGHDH